MAIILKINNREVNEKELIEEWQQVKKSLSQDKFFSNSIENEKITLRSAKENIINRVLLEEEAELVVSEVDYKLIQEEFEKIISHYGGWEKMLSCFKNKISKFTIKTNIEKSLKINKLLNIWGENISLPNEAEMMSYYEHNRSRFVSPKRVLFSKFFLPIDPKFPENKFLMEELYQYRNQQKNYHDFLDHALKIPHLTYQEKFYLTHGEINPKVEKKLLSLQDQEISGIIQTQEGFHLFKRHSTIPRQELEYDMVRKTIEKVLFEEKKQKKIRENLIDLRKEATIEDFFSNPEETIK